MIWVPIAMCSVIAAGIYAIFDSSTKTAEKEWKDAKNKFEMDSMAFKAEVESEKIKANRLFSSPDFDTFMKLRKLSIQIADAAFSNKHNVDKIIYESYQTINKLKDERRELAIKLDGKLSKDERDKLFAEYTEVKNLMSYLYDTIATHKVQRDEFYDKVRIFNSSTHDLNIYIRDNCGYGGRVWYENLQRRKLSR